MRDFSCLNLDVYINIGYSGGTPNHHRSSSNGRNAGGMSTGMAGGVSGADVDLRQRDSSLPRVYEDPDELAASNQVFSQVDFLF